MEENTMKILKILGIASLLISLTSPVWSDGNENYTIRDKNYVTQGYVRNGKIYNRDYKIEGYVNHGKVYDRDYNVKGYYSHNGKYGYGKGSKSGRSK
jgi:hypothetical protein